jgi:hypothetical protein
MCFDNKRYPTLPDIHVKLKTLEIPGPVVAALIEDWTRRPGYQKAKEARRLAASDARSKAAVARLAVLAPALFDPANPVPLAIGIDRQFIGPAGSADRLGRTALVGPAVGLPGCAGLGATARQSGRQRMDSGCQWRRRQLVLR